MPIQPKMDALEIVRQMDQGAVAFGFAQRMAEVVKAVRETGKKGKITLELSIEPLPKFGESATSLKPQIKASVPYPDYKQAIKFAAQDGTLSGDDPKQRKFEEVEKSFSASTQEIGA